MIFIISGPSGVGKTTIVKEILKIFPDIKFSVSATTRKPRSNEVNKKDYIFLSKKEFEEKIKNNELIEWTKVGNNYYGTPRGFFERCLKNNNDIILTVDVTGALNLKKLYPESVLIFLLPPSYEELKSKLEKSIEKIKSIIIKEREKYAG